MPFLNKSCHPQEEAWGSHKRRSTALQCKARFLVCCKGYEPINASPGELLKRKVKEKNCVQVENSYIFNGSLEYDAGPIVPVILVLRNEDQ